MRQDITKAFKHIQQHQPQQQQQQQGQSDSLVYPYLRSVVLTGAGPSFSAGADLNWMKEMKSYSAAENERDAIALWDMLESIYSCPLPVIARVNGSALGGGVGLIAACDIALATQHAKFGLTVLPHNTDSNTTHTTT